MSARFKAYVDEIIEENIEKDEKIEALEKALCKTEDEYCKTEDEYDSLLRYLSEFPCPKTPYTSDDIVPDVAVAVYKEVNHMKKKATRELEEREKII